MGKRNVKTRSALLLAVMMLCSASVVHALDFPKSYVRIIVPYAAGGSAESQARTLAEQLGKIWKQQVIIENKPGAGTTIGAAFVAGAEPDGYTLYLAGTSHTVSPSLYSNLKYDPVRSFAPVSRLATSPFILLVNPKLGVNSVAELIELARSKPGKLNYGTSGIGAGPHLSAEMFKATAKIDVTHVPFKGSAPAMTALLGNFIDFAFGDVSSLSTVKAGSLKALAVTSLDRFAELPDVPTFNETVSKGFEVTNWSCILAPDNTPPELVAFLNQSISEALATPEVKRQFAIQGFEPTASTPQALRDLLTSEVNKYAEVLKNAGVEPAR
ncbi:MAG: Tripartite-type tricarboxylate transporter receptor subunit TctC [Bradyrhizobium sp.]|nr:Tripartite-type tricarboxylate transporter receptor subunit TctC [Bradyrhizobium sp.]